MNFLTVDANQVFDSIAQEENIPLDDYDDFYIPSREDDWNRRFGLKGRPVSEEIEVSRISAVLHRSTLRQSCHLSNILHGSNFLGKILPDKIT